MAARLNAFRIKDWQKPNDKTFCYEGEDRPAVRIGIGELQQVDGTKQYLIEPFYEDILPLIDERNVTVHIDVYSEPMVVLEVKGKLVIHNANVMLLKEETIEALRDDKVVTIGSQLKCLAELRRNMQAGEKIGTSTKALREILSDGLNKKVSYDFIRLILKEMYVGVDTENELASLMYTMSNSELIDLHSGIINKELTNGTNINPLMKLLTEGYNFEAVKSAYQNEVTRRFYEGSIR